MSASHVPPTMLARYAAGATDAGPADSLVVESHLESCAGCRDRLAAVMDERTASIVDRVRRQLDAAVPASPRMPRRRVPRGRLAAPATAARLAMTGLVVLTAVLLDLAKDTSLVLLLAPVAPLVAVAAAWSRGLDPAYEVVVASPRAGIDLVLRRTAGVLFVVIPALTVAGWLVGASPARWLLPCLAFTIGALALGDVIGLHRAATGLAAAWSLAVVAPSVVTARPTVLLSPDALPGWAAATVVVAAALALRRRGYTTLRS